MEMFNLQNLQEKLIKDSDKKNCDDLIELHQKIIDGIEVEEHAWRKIYDLADANREHFTKLIRETK